MQNNIKLKVFKASRKFYTSLEGIIDPEEKRKIIGEGFVDVMNTILEKEGLSLEDSLLLQGTIYPDTIESGGTDHADTIKTHHNRVEGINRLILDGKVIEPLKDFYKDEVRKIGKSMNLQDNQLKRRPFPGPGLAIRTLCTAPIAFDSKLEAEVNELLMKKGYFGRVLPVKSVGIEGDKRTYTQPVVISGTFDWDVLSELSRSITNTFPLISRVTYMLQPTELNSLTIFQAGISKKRTRLLRKSDYLAHKILDRFENNVWQMPVVLLPVRVNNSGETIVLRPVDSKEAMTANFSRLPNFLVEKMAERLMKIRGIGSVLYDITDKPPGTIEWE